MQAGIHPTKKTGRAISSALGYAQLLDANSVNEVSRSGATFIARLNQKLHDPGNTPQRIASLKHKIVVLKKMYANCKRVPFEWDKHQAYAKTPPGMGVHTINIDGDIGVIPIHTLGLTTTGSLPSGPLGLHYIAEFGSGRAGQSSAAVAPQPSLNDNNTPSMNLGLWLRPEVLDGLQLGVSLYHDRLTLADTSKAPIGETIGVAHIVYKTDVLELMTEGMLMRHDPRDATPTSDSKGYYAQASRRFGTVRPYVRMDYLDVPKTDQLLAFLGRRSGPTVGVRYDFQPLAALKLQTSHLNQTTRPNMNRFDAQVSFMF